MLASECQEQELRSWQGCLAGRARGRRGWGGWVALFGGRGVQGPGFQPPSMHAGPHASCSAAVESGLREHLATAQRTIRLAQLACKHELPGEAAPGEAAQQVQGAAGPGVEDEQAAEGLAAAGSSANIASCDDCGSQPGHVDELGLEDGSSGQRLLEAFMRRMGSTALDGAALGHERLLLSAENATLRAVVAAVRGGTSLGPGAVDDPLNTLLVVNGRLQKQLARVALARSAVARAGSGSTSLRV